MGFLTLLSSSPSLFLPPPFSFLTHTQLAEALFSSGRVMEGLFLVNAGIEAAKSGPPPTAEQQELALLSLISGFPLISLGSSDACGFVPDFQYCHIDVATIYLRFGLCVPAACNAQDVQLGLNATYFKLTKSYLDRYVQPSLHPSLSPAV